MMKRADEIRKNRGQRTRGGRGGRQSIDHASSAAGRPEDGGEVDIEFDAIDIDDVLHQARSGRIVIADLDAF